MSKPINKQEKWIEEKIRELVIECALNLSDRNTPGENKKEVFRCIKGINKLIRQTISQARMEERDKVGQEMFRIGENKLAEEKSRILKLLGGLEEKGRANENAPDKGIRAFATGVNLTRKKFNQKLKALKKEI